MWNRIKDLVNSKSIDDVKRLFALLAPELGFKRVEELAAMKPRDLAALMTKVFGDIPLTQWDDNLRLATAEKLIRYARKEVAESKPPPAIGQPKQETTAGYEYVVKGTVRQIMGSLPAHLTVKAFDQGLRDRRVLLGETKIATGGHYAIGYERDRLIDPTQGRANLVVEVLDGRGSRVALSKVKFAAGRNEVIDFTIDSEAGRSEWERLEALIEPLLQDTRLAHLDDDDLAFLARSRQTTRETLQPVVHAARAAEQSELPRWFHYALIRKGLPGKLDPILNIPGPRIAETIATAQGENIIPTVTKKDLAALQRRLTDLQADAVLEQPLPGRTIKAGRFVDLVGLTKPQQRKLAVAMVGHKPREVQDWEPLAAIAGLDAARTERLQWGLKLAHFTDDHEATFAALLQDRRITGQRDLARHYDPQDWESLVRRTAAEDDLPKDLDGETSEARQAQYARRLYARAANAHPTVAVTYGLARQDALKKNHAVQLLPRMVENDEAFDLASTRLDTYVAHNQKLLGLKSTQQVRKTTENLKRIQRLYRLKPEMTVVAALLADETITSARSIVDQGQQRFMETYGAREMLGPETAQAVYREAEKTAAQAFGFLAHFSPTINTTPLPTAIEKCPAELQGVPDYAALFGSLDGCRCEPCQSVYSPAAYLTDLLAFVEQEVTRDPDFERPDLVAANGLRALESRSYCDSGNQLVANRPRRPDIARTLLSCRNAETEIPYVDLVLEIMENAVAPRDGEKALQTGLPAEQLAARAEHFNAGAYRTLAKAIFPFDLPFDLWHEEETIYLEKLGTSRAEVLEALFPFPAAQQPDQAPHDLTEIHRWQDEKIAQARLGLTENAWRLVTGQPLPPATVTVAAETWGYSALSGNNWWHPLRKADTLMARSGLSYEDLLRLLHLRAFNPTGAIGIAANSLGACDPKEINLKGLNVAAIGFLHRFLRLQRGLGWSLRELDQALLALSPPSSISARPALDAASLLRLSHLTHLQERFGLPRDELLSWWSLLDTRDYRMEQLPDEDVRPALYARLFLAGRAGEPAFDAFQLDPEGRDLADPDQALADQRPAIAGALGLTVPDVKRLAEDVLEEAPKLTLANLSLLFRHASLSRALQLKIEDYLTLKKLIGFDPFTAHQSSPNLSLDPTLQTIRFVERATAVANSGLSIAELHYLLHQTMPFEGRTVAPTDAWAQASLTSLLEAGQAEVRSASIKTALADILDLPAPVCKVLLEETRLPADENQTAIEALLSVIATPQAPSEPEAAPQGDQKPLLELLYRLHKAALVIGRLGIQSHELLDDGDRPGYLALHGATGWLDLLGLPVRAADPATSFDAWLRTVRLFQLRDVLLPEQQDRFFKLFDHGANETGGGLTAANEGRRAYYRQLAALTGWPENDLRALVGHFDSGAISHGGGGGLEGRFSAAFRR